MGTELIGVTVGEASDPRRNIPSAIKKVGIRQSTQDRTTAQTLLTWVLSDLLAYSRLLHWRSLLHFAPRRFQRSGSLRSKPSFDFRCCFTFRSGCTSTADSGSTKHHQWRNPYVSSGIRLEWLLTACLSFQSSSYYLLPIAISTLLAEPSSR